LLIDFVIPVFKQDTRVRDFVSNIAQYPNKWPKQQS